MNALMAEPAEVIGGVGWRAEVHYAHILLAVDPLYADRLAGAVSKLIAKPQRRFWTVEFMYEDDHGWDVYLIERNLVSNALQTNLA